LPFLLLSFLKRTPRYSSLRGESNQEDGMEPIWTAQMPILRQAQIDTKLNFIGVGPKRPQSIEK